MIRIARTATASAAIAGAIGAALIGFGAGHAAAVRPLCDPGQNYADGVTTADAQGVICESLSDGSFTYAGTNRNTGDVVIIPDVRYDSALGLRSYTATASDGTVYLVLPDHELKIYSPAGSVIFDEPSIY